MVTLDALRLLAGRTLGRVRTVPLHLLELLLDGLGRNPPAEPLQRFAGVLLAVLRQQPHGRFRYEADRDHGGQRDRYADGGRYAPRGDRSEQVDHEEAQHDGDAGAGREDAADRGLAARRTDSYELLFQAFFD